MTEITGASTLVRNPELLSVEMDGDLVMMSIESGNYFGVSGIGPSIWSFLETPKQFDEVVNEIVENFEVEPELAAADLHKFVAEMAQNGMIEVS